MFNIYLNKERNFDVFKGCSSSCIRFTSWSTISLSYYYTINNSNYHKTFRQKSNRTNNNKFIDEKKQKTLNFFFIKRKNRIKRTKYIYLLIFISNINQSYLYLKHYYFYSNYRKTKKKEFFMQFHFDNH